MYPRANQFPQSISLTTTRTRFLNVIFQILVPLAIEKIGDLEKLLILLQNQSFWKIVGAQPTAAPRSSGRDNAAGIMIIWWTGPPRILQIHSLHQVATGTPFHIPLRCCGIIITTFHGFGTNCMVPYKWDSASRCVCGPDFISDLIREAPIFLASRQPLWIM